MIETLKERPMSLKELSRKWQNSSQNDDKGTLSRRTFQEHKNAINALGIGVEIVYEPTIRCYVLKSDPDNSSPVTR
ncbi:MAG: hypothetical protein LUD15_15610 [Bacteroides sp.]|nr:hypothetical protein [Bacteroides sp.]